jgi:hypothetical protein
MLTGEGLQRSSVRPGLPANRTELPIAARSVFECEEEQCSRLEVHSETCSDHVVVPLIRFFRSRYTVFSEAATRTNSGLLLFQKAMKYLVESQ